MSEMSGRLVEAAESEIGNYCIHTDPVSAGCDCSVQARRAVVAVLRELADNAMPAVYNTDPAIWYAGELEALADWIEAAG